MGASPVALLKMLFRLLFLALFLAPFVLPLMTIQREPLVLESEAPLFDDIEAAKLVLKRFDPRMMSASNVTKVTVRATEISQAFSAALSRFSRIRSRVEAH